MRRLALPALVLCLLAVSAKSGTKGTDIPADTISPKKGGALSARTPVARPRTAKGARSWTIETRRHRWLALDVVTSPDGALVATSGYDGMVRVWDTATGKLQRVLVGHDSYVYGMAWSADGRYLASSGSFDLSVRVWEVKTGLPLKVLTKFKEATGALAFSPDGSLLACGTFGSGDVVIYRIAESRKLATFSNGKPVVSLAFSPDCKTLACAVSQVGVNLLTSPDWKADGKIDLTGQEPRAVSFSSDGKELLVPGTKNVTIWDVAGKKVARRYDVPCSAVARHGKQLAVSSPAGKLLDLETGKEGGAVPTGHAASWSNDGKVLCILGGDLVLSMDGSTGREKKRWSVAESGNVRWSPGRPVVSGIGSPKLRLFDAATGKVSHTLEHNGGASVVAWSPDSKSLVSGGNDKTVRVWTAATGKLARTLEGFDGAVTAVAMASDGRIAAGSADKKLRLFAAGSTKASETHPGDGMAVRALTWGRDGKLASGGNDASVKLWGTEAKKPLHVIPFAGSVESLAFAPNGKMLAAGASEDHVRIWSYPGRKLLHELESAGSPPAVTALAWTPDSASLLAGRANHTAQVWDVKTGKTRHNLAVMAPVHSTSWAAGGTSAVTCTIDRSVRFWSAASGQIQTTLVADGEQLATISAEGHYRVPSEKETELVFVVLTKTGMDTLTPAAFAEKYAWKNNPALARIPLK